MKRNGDCSVVKPSPCLMRSLIEQATMYPYLPAIVMGTLAAVAGLLGFFLPETRGAALPDTVNEANKHSGYDDVILIVTLQLKAHVPKLFCVPLNSVVMGCRCRVMCVVRSVNVALNGDETAQLKMTDRCHSRNGIPG